MFRGIQSEHALTRWAIHLWFRRLSIEWHRYCDPWRWQKGHKAMYDNSKAHLPSWRHFLPLKKFQSCVATSSNLYNGWKASTGSGKRAGDNALSQIHHNGTIIQKGKAIVLYSAEIKIARTEVKTPIGEFSLWVISYMIYFSTPDVESSTTDGQSQIGSNTLLPDSYGPSVLTKWVSIQAESWRDALNYKEAW